MCVVKEFNFMFHISMLSQFAWSTQDNGVHASAGPLEALRERMVPAGTGTSERGDVDDVAMLLRVGEKEIINK